MPNLENKGNPRFNHAGHMAEGTLWGFLGSAVSLPTGLLTSALLTRKLGPHDYGILTVTASLIVWVEIVITAGFSRAAIKFISESRDHEPVSTKFLQIQTFFGLLAAIAVFLSAPVISSWINSPEMTVYIRAYALSIPITSISNTHIATLIGLGRYGQRAILNAVFWIFRLIFIFWFVTWKPSVMSAIWATITSSLVVLLWARVYVQPAIFARSNFPLKNIWDYGWPMFLFTVCLNMFGQMDLFFVKALCRPPEIAGYYSAAKNLTILPAMFTASFTPLLIGKLSILSQKDEHRGARDMCRKSIHFMICLLPFAAMASGSSEEIVTLIYGKAFSSAAEILAVLIFAALGIAIIAVTSSTLMAAGRPVLNLIAAFPILGLCIPGLYMGLPRYGPTGAAFIVGALAWTGGLINTIIVSRIWSLSISFWIIIRSVAVAGVMYCAAFVWKAGGLLLVLKLPALAVATVLIFIITGVIAPQEFKFVMFSQKFKKTGL